MNEQDQNKQESDINSTNPLEQLSQMNQSIPPVEDPKLEEGVDNTQQQKADGQTGIQNEETKEFERVEKERNAENINSNPNPAQPSQDNIASNKYV
jgi:hypothetical protein